MDFGQQRLQQQEAAKQMMYQNSGYQFERRDKKTLILYHDITGAENKDFTMKLVEPLKIDKLSDDVINIANQFDINKFHLVGHDWGSAVGYHWS